MAASEHGDSEHGMSEYRIEDLAHLSGSTVRTIRAYQDRGLLPRPERRGRANVYDDTHLARLRQIAELLTRGYTLASIKELLEAWDSGRGLGGVLGLVTEVDGPWTDEQPSRLTRAELHAYFGGEDTDQALAEAVALGVLIPHPDGTGDGGSGDGGSGDGDEPAAAAEFVVPSPRELAVAAELHAAGVPLAAITGQLRELRAQVEHIAARFLDFTNEHVFIRYLGQEPEHPGTEPAGLDEAAELVRRLRPLAQQAVDAELGRAMRVLSARSLRSHLRAAAAAPPPAPGAPALEAVLLPAATLASVRALVGEESAAAFIAAAADRETAARTMDGLAKDGLSARPGGGGPSGARACP